MERSLHDLVRGRAGGRCEYCGMYEACDSLGFQVDHVIARKHGGLDEADNLAWACWTCNVHKGPNIAGVDPQTGQVVPLYHPRRDLWVEHFRWTNAELQGLTPAARTTIDVLAINAPHRVALRASLLQEGLTFE